MPTETELDVLIVGAGFAGMYQLKLLRDAGLRVLVLEKGSGVGGTWYWNRYPGARCDIESMQYSMTWDKALEQEWTWSERYAAQPEILAYANEIADRHDLRRDIRFETLVASAVWDEAAARWVVTTGEGEALTARFVVMATGCLSTPNSFTFPGQETFRGPIYQTGLWPHEGVDFTGLRVAVIGTGSSAIQSIPIIAEQAAELHVFQRTPNYAVPAHNRPLSDAEVAEVKANYDRLRATQQISFAAADFHADPNAVAMQSTPEEREAVYEGRWADGGLGFMAAYTDLMFDPKANVTAADFVRGKIREIVDDPQVAEALCPTNTIGCKRLCVDTGYYATYNLPHVHLVDVSKTPIDRISETGVHVGDRVWEVDAIVMATGFDAMTGALLAMDVRGRGGRTIQQKWAEGPKSYLGLAIEGFPNLFTVTGPGSPSVFTNMLPSIEQHCEWIAACITRLDTEGRREIEAEAAAEHEWVLHNIDVASHHLRSSCSSWYLGANIPGKPRVFMPYIGGFPRYVEKCREVVENGYEGFRVA